MPKELYDQIVSLDRELGSGSLKLAYRATLRDGRRIVIKLGREFVSYRTAREIQLMREIIEEVQRDPELHVENIEAVSKEVERIIVSEMNFAAEYDLEREHKKAVESRPFLIRSFGSTVRVYVPQPLEGWQADGILVEEFVEAAHWNDLPERALLGWSKDKLARAAVDEVLNQLLSYMNPAERQSDGKIIIDIDPHEENQLARSRFKWFGKRMVNIDLGQSVRVEPETLRGLVRIIYAIHQGDVERAINLSQPFMILETAAKVDRYRTELNKQTAASTDPVEVFTRTLEEVELDGVALRQEFLFFQKLFATLVGMKRHIKDPNYILHRMQKIVFLRALTNPAQAYREYQSLKQGEATTAQPRLALDCAGVFAM